MVKVRTRIPELETIPSCQGSYRNLWGRRQSAHSEIWLTEEGMLCLAGSSTRNHCFQFLVTLFLQEKLFLLMPSPPDLEGEAKGS